MAYVSDNLPLWFILAGFALDGIAMSVSTLSEYSRWCAHYTYLAPTNYGTLIIGRYGIRASLGNSAYVCNILCGSCSYFSNNLTSHIHYFGKIGTTSNFLLGAALLMKRNQEISSAQVISKVLCNERFDFSPTRSNDTTLLKMQIPTVSVSPTNVSPNNSRESGWPILYENMSVTQKNRCVKQYLHVPLLGEQKQT